MAATRSADGTWGAAVKLSGNRDGRVDVAIDGAGDAIAAFGQLHVSGITTTATEFTSTRQAGGTWGAPTVLSVPGDNAITPRAAADTAGTLVVGWTDSTTNTLSVLTSPPGGSFGPAATFPAGAISDLKIAPGHAVLSIKPVIPTAPASISSEPVS